MTHFRRILVGAVAGAALLTVGAATQAQDSSDTEASAPQSTAPMGAQPQYCVPGCVVGPMEGDDMHHGMMGQGPMPMMAPGMMNQGMMPMMGYGMMGPGMMPMMGYGMMGPGMMPMMGYGMMGQGAMPMMMSPGMMNQGMMPMTGQGMMGQGMMGQDMMGQGMMGQGMMGQGMMPMMGANAAAPLDPDNVRPHLEHHLAMMGLPNLVLGSIEAQDDDTLVAEIVTKDGTIVQRLAIDRHNGTVTPLE